MTEAEYNAKIAEISTKEDELREERREVQKKYIETLNLPWKEYLFKKVKIKYSARVHWHERKEMETICYWGGVSLKYSSPYYTFYQVKKDGTQSSRTADLGWDVKLISMELAE